MFVLFFAGSVQGMTYEDTAEIGLEKLFNQFKQNPNLTNYQAYLDARKSFGEPTSFVNKLDQDIEILAYKNDISRNDIKPKLLTFVQEIRKNYERTLNKPVISENVSDFSRLLNRYIRDLEELVVLQEIRNDITAYFVSLAEFWEKNNDIKKASENVQTLETYLNAWKQKYPDQESVSSNVREKIQKVRRNIDTIIEAEAYIKEIKDEKSTLVQVIEAFDKLSDLLSGIKEIDQKAREMLLDAQFAYDAALLKEYGVKDLGTLKGVLKYAEEWKKFAVKHKISESFSKKLDEHSKKIQEHISKLPASQRAATAPAGSSVSPTSATTTQQRAATAPARTTIPRRTMFPKTSAQNLPTALQKLQSALSDLSTQLKTIGP